MFNQEALKCAKAWTAYVSCHEPSLFEMFEVTTVIQDILFESAQQKKNAKQQLQTSNINTFAVMYCKPFEYVTWR